MDYKRIYNELIDRAKTRSINKGEWHHIIPRSMDGSDDKDNLVHLTYREHFIAHMLLYQIYKNRQMAYALGRMRNSGTDHNISAKSYELARYAHSKAVSEWSKCYMPGKTVFKNLKTGEMRLLNVDEVDPTEWRGGNYGRTMTKAEAYQGKTVFKDSLGKTYCLKTDDPLIKELNLVGVGNTVNATKVSAMVTLSRPWYAKKKTADINILKNILIIYDWYCEQYDSSRPKATGLAKCLAYHKIPYSKIYRKAFLEFIEGWKPDKKFYDTLNALL